jgi:hypothetical protein
MSFTQEIFKQSQKVEQECQKLQALLDDKLPRVTFKWNKNKDEILLFKRKRQRTVIRDDNPENDEDDEDDEPIVKQKLDVLFKKEDNNNDNDDQNNNNVNDNADEDSEEDEDLIRFLSGFSQQLQDVPVTWEGAPQSPWSQHQEPMEQNQEHVQQNHVIVPNIVEPIQIPYMYTPEGVGLFF